MAGDQEFDLLEPVALAFGLVERIQCHHEGAASHRQALHGVRDGAGQRLGGGLARGGQVPRQRQVGGACGGLAGQHLVDVLRGLQVVELLAAGQQFVRQLLRRQAVLARRRVQRLHARFHGLQAFRIEFEPVDVARQRMRGFLDLHLRRFQRGEHVAQRGIDIGQLLEPVHHAVEHGQHGAIGLGQRFQRGAAAVDQAGRVREAVVFALDLFPFARLGRQLVEFAHLPFQPLALKLHFARLRLHGLALAHAGAPGPPRLRHRAGLFGQARVGVEQVALGVRPQQQLVGVLAVDVHELVAHLAQLGQRGRRAVDERLATAARIDGAAQQHGAFAVQAGLVAGQLTLGQPGVERCVRAEGGADACAGAAFAHHAGVGAFAEHQGQCIDQDGLAGAGLAGEDGKAGGEVEVERIDDDEIADGQAAEHRGLGGSGGRLRAGCPRSGIRASAASCAAWRSSCSRPGAAG
ncbi:hypothetical protein D3C72_1146060 [compost metagenome]